ncbi:MAG: zinc-dependent metalloprotease family protein [Phycisphaerales bacterium]
MLSSFISRGGMPRSAFVSGLLALTLASAAGAQFFSFVDRPSDLAPFAGSVPGPRPLGGSVVFSDHERLAAAVARAPEQDLARDLATYGMVIQLPTPDGQLIDAFIARSPVMEPELAARYPQLQTFIVRTGDGSATGRLEVTPRGLTAMLRTTEGEAWMIDPAWSGDETTLMSYALRDLSASIDWTCHTDAAKHGKHRPRMDGAGGHTTRATQSLLTARVAMACTGEYGVHQSTIQGHAPNVADPLAAIVTVIARANVVYEADLGVHFNLVGDEDKVVFFDPDTDPFPTTCDGLGGADCSSPVLNALPGALSSKLSSVWDIAHCMTRVAGGVAYLWDVCSGNGGVSGIPRGGDIDPFSALVVIHEMGHQFGANHTFSGTRGRCGNNANLSTAWEAGSGSSPMAYAGGCPVGDAPPSDNIVQFADPFFHHGSIEEMRAFIPFATCMGSNGSSNNVPIIWFVTPNQPIPPATPFALSAAATDADGELLTYSWEQFDNGVRRPLEGDGSEDNGQGSLFRAFPPTLDSWRTFPSMSGVLAGGLVRGERLPTVTGVGRKFRVVVRDNHPGVGATATSSMVTLTIAPGTSAFGVTAPVESALVNAGPDNPVNVTWTVGNTDAAPISAASVEIRLSTDNGLTWPYFLGTFPNSGSASVVCPIRPTSGARVKVDAAGKIFFAVSRPFTLVNPCPADFNHDGFVNGNDYDDFAALFDVADPGADFNHDGFVNGNDYDEFADHFDVGC